MSKIRSLVFLFSLLLCPLLLLAQNQQSNSRLALVIGNSDYEAGSLKNPVNDAILIAKTLDSLHFDVLLDTNISTKRDFQNVIRKFGERRPLYEVAFIYYAGHGVQIGYENYLLPTKESFHSEFDVEDYGVSVRSILRYLNNTTDQANILILDACRNNPFESNWTRTRSAAGKGLAEISPPNGSLIAFSTDAGRTAADGKEGNSIYTSSLAANLLKPNVEITQVFKNVRTEVLEKTMNEQSPVENSKLTGGELFLNYQEDKLVVSLEQELDILFDRLDTLEIWINNQSDRRILRIGDQYANGVAESLFLSFNSLALKLESLNQSLYESALFGMIKTGMIASSGLDGTFSNDYLLNKSYEAASELYALSKIHNFMPPKGLVKRLRNNSHYFQHIGIAYLIYSNYYGDSTLVWNDSKLLDVIVDFDAAYDTLDYTTQLVFLHTLQQLVIFNKVDPNALPFLAPIRKEYSNDITISDNYDLLFHKFTLFRYIGLKADKSRVVKDFYYDTSVGIFIVSELRCKLLWIQNYCLLLNNTSFKEWVSINTDDQNFIDDIEKAINDLTMFLGDFWNESEEIDRLLSFKDTELQLIVDVLTNQTILINNYSQLLGKYEMDSDRFFLNECVIQSYESISKYFKHPDILDYASSKEYDYLVVSSKLNSYANGSALNIKYPKQYPEIRIKTQSYLHDIEKWYNDLFSSTDRIDTLDERFINSYLYFARRVASWECSSHHESLKVYLNAARLTAKLGWKPAFMEIYFSNRDVELFWENVYYQSTIILSDTTYNFDFDQNRLNESIELLQHYRDFYDTKFNQGSVYTLKASFKILVILELCPKGNKQGLRINEWNALARAFTDLQEVRMNRLDDDLSELVSNDWNTLLSLMELKLNQVDKGQKELIIQLFQNKLSQVPVFRDNQVTIAFKDGLSKFDLLFIQKD